MRCILLIARREVKDHIRQPSIIIGAIGFYLLVELLFASIFGIVSSQIDNPAVQQLLGGKTPDALAAELVGAYNSYVVFEPAALAGLLGGHAFINDRERGTLPFLLLTPVSRVQLLVGKVLGCALVALSIHVLIGGVQTWALSRFELAQMASQLLPFSLSWVIGFLAGTTAWTLASAALAVILGAVIKDIRGSLAFGSLLGFVLTTPPIFAVGFTMDDTLLASMVALAGFAFTAVLIVVGQFLIKRDLSR